MASLFLTGASGFIGRVLLPQLVAASHRVVVLERSAAAGTASTSVERVRGDLREPSGWAAALQGIDTVLHLGAVTGKAPRGAYHETNVQGTAALLHAARRHGVARFLFLSTIATRYRDAPHYHYARSKENAESAVRTSSLRCTILRPTIVLGPGSPIGARLRLLAALPIMPVPGRGDVRVQPIDVRDLVALIVALLQSDRFRGETVEAGGPDVLTMTELLARLRARLGRAPGRRVHVPLTPLRAALAALERVALPLAPVTAGQLAAFRNDSVADTHPFVQARWPGMRGIDEMVHELAAHG